MYDFPSQRVRTMGQREVDRQGDYVLYWMIASRRSSWNFSLQRARDWAAELQKPLLVFEALRGGYRWASDRLHAFVVQGMVDNQRRFADAPATYYPYLEPEPGAGSGLLAALSKQAAVVVSDDFPCFFLPHMVRAAAKQIPVRFELVDSNGILPLRATDKVFLRAFDFRRYLQNNLRPHLAEFPEAEPLSRAKLPRLDQLPKTIAKNWPAAEVAKIASDLSLLGDFPIDHHVRPAPLEGGAKAAEQALAEFVERKLGDYAAERNEPDKDATSGLSPYLHFGHISAHEAVDAVLTRDKWSPDKLAKKANGSANGWWGTSEEVEGFLDELITWREVGYNMCAHTKNYDEYESLPDWAQETLAEHAEDRREHTYSLSEFEAAETHDELWNAAQRQLVVEGRIHNYLRMVWGKKILEWSTSPRIALDIMIELNNKYAVDGRNPNSYSGIFWVLGRYDRPWGPERRVFGKVRYMSCENTARKVSVKQYLHKYGSVKSAQRELF
jgi:deoxyribodipyrimidine photo-lyase